MERRPLRIVGTLAIPVLITVAACTSTATPSLTAPGTKPTATSVPFAKPTSAPEAKPTAAAIQATRPAASPIAKPVASADWKAEWDKTVASAKQEGKVVVAGGSGTSNREAATAFRKAYPDIQVEYIGMSGSELAPKIIAEQQGGQYLVDAYVGGATTSLTLLRPTRAVETLKPLLMLPEVLDSSKWQGGFDESWVDNEGQYVFQFTGYLNAHAFVNRKVVSESELSKVDQLLDSKWKGKIVSQDPRTSGKASQDIGFLLLLKGEDWIRKLLAQDLVIVANSRQRGEAVVTGRLPVGLGLDTPSLDEFIRAGVAGHVEPLDFESPDGAHLVSGFGNVVLLNKAPHPNAAKVFINWLLSKEGQKAYVEATTANSRRLDVEGPAETALNPNVKYENISLERNQRYHSRAMEIAKEVIK